MSLALSLALRADPPVESDPPELSAPPPVFEAWLSVPAPQALEREFAWAMAEPAQPRFAQLAVFPGMLLQAPRMTAEAAWLPCPAAEPLAREVRQVAATEVQACGEGELRAAGIPGVRIQAPRMMAEADWLPSPAAEPLVREVRQVAATEVQACGGGAAGRLRTAELAGMLLQVPRMTAAADWRPCPAAEPLVREVRQVASTAVQACTAGAAPELPAFARIEPASDGDCAFAFPKHEPVMPRPSIPAMGGARRINHLQQTADMVLPKAQEGLGVPFVEAGGFAIVETPACGSGTDLVAAANFARAEAFHPAPVVPDLNVSMAAPAVAELREPISPRRVAEPVERVVDWHVSPEPALHRADSTLPAFAVTPALEPIEPPAEAAEEEQNYATADFVQLEFYSHRLYGKHRIDLHWMMRRSPVVLPAFSVGPVPDERLSGSLDKPRVAPGRAAVIPMPAPSGQAEERRKRWRVTGAVAAGLCAGMLIWGGANAVQVGSRTFAVKWDASRTGADRKPAALARADARPKGPVAWVRDAAARRAALEMSDSFRTGMEAWGAPAKGWARGWSRHSDGYVQTGQLALFGPSMAFKDYRLEFFGQIDKRSMGWVVRARDNGNYHAMKFTVVQPGLRPVLAMVHYPVVGGKPGRKVEIPLSVMIHKDEPYRVSVNVKGNRIMTSVDGHPVDTWTATSPATGGIGFFSDAGDKARLYWMKVVANDDFVGRMCAYVASALGPESQVSAAIWPAGNPGGSRPAPAGPHPGAPASAAVAVYFSKHRRMRSWMS